MESKKESMRVLLIEPMKKPRQITIPLDAAHIQELVGSHFEVIYPWEDPVALICGSEGKYDGSAPNRVLEETEDIIFGAFLITGLTYENFGSLPEDLIPKFVERFQYPELISRTMDGKIACLRMVDD